MNNVPTTILNFNQQSGFTLIELMVMIGSKLLLLETHKNQIIDLKKKRPTGLFLYTLTTWEFFFRSR